MAADFASVWDMAKDRSACRELQRALDESGDIGRLAIAEGLKSHVWDCIFCKNANHVLQQTIVVFRSSRVQFIIDEIMEQPNGALLASMHKFGCRIMQRLLEHCRSDQLRPLVEELFQNDILRLSNHKFGNFVVQHIMEHGTSSQKHFIATAIIDAMGEMHNEYPLNVFEMVLSQGLVEDRIRLRLALLGHYQHIIKKAVASRRRKDMPHLMLLDHAKQRLDFGSLC